MKSHSSSDDSADGSPQLINRRANRESVFRMGRTIGEKREKLETKSERTAARKKDKKRQAYRLLFTIVGIVLLIVVLFIIGRSFLDNEKPLEPESVSASYEYKPTIEVIDEADTSNGESKITSRMELFIGQLEQDLRDLGHHPVKAVIPSDTIREVDIYLEGYDGYFKTHIDRASAVTAEDIDRMLRYLTQEGISTFEYVDVRVQGKAYWK